MGEFDNLPKHSKKYFTKGNQASVHRSVALALRNQPGPTALSGMGGVGMNIQMLVDDHGLRKRMMSGPAVIARMWKKDMSAMARAIFGPPIKRRTPVRRERRTDYRFRKGPSGRPQIADRPALKGGARGKLKGTFNAYGTLERIRITMGGKKTPYAAVIEQGSVPHMTEWRHDLQQPVQLLNPTRSIIAKPSLSRLAAQIQSGETSRRRTAGGGFHPGFPGFHMMARGVTEALPEWLRQYRIYNYQFVRYLAAGRMGSEGVAMSRGLFRPGGPAGIW